MKGFVRIIETIIASIIILTSLSFFLPSLAKQSGWDPGIAEIRTLDVINALHTNGSVSKAVRANNITELRISLENFIGRSSDFSVEIIGIPNPVIYTGCVCSNAEFDDIKNQLGTSAGGNTSFLYKGRKVEIRLEQVTVSNTDSNIFLFMNMNSLNNNYTDLNTRNSMLRFLESGGTIMLIGDITQAQAGNDASAQIFNISWSSSPSVPVAGGVFHEYNNVSRITYNVAKYYKNTTGIGPSVASFSSFDTSLANKISLTNRTILKDGSGLFSFSVGNKNVVNGNGRALWIAGSDWSEEIKNLTKAVIMWASGERYKMDIAKKTPPRTSQRASVIIYDSDPYEFRVTSWGIF